MINVFSRILRGKRVQILSDAFRISRYPYVELAYKSVQLTRGLGSQQRSSTSSASSFGNSLKIFHSAMNNAKYSKAMMAIFNSIAVAVPFAVYGSNPNLLTLASSVALSLAISFGYFLLYSLQILPSFVSTDPFALISTLPLDKIEFQRVLFFSFFRTVDYLVFSSLASQLLVVSLLTHSLAATLLILLSSIFNLIFAATVGLWLSRIFYRNLSRGGRSKAASLVRFVFLLTWAFAGISVGFVFNFIRFAVPELASVISGNSPETIRLLLLVLHPFSTGLVVASVMYPRLLLGSFASNLAGQGGYARVLDSLPFASMGGYFVLAILAARFTANSVLDIAKGGGGRGTKVIREKAREFYLRLRNPLVAYIVKDLRISSKNPATAFVFALPLFEIVLLILSTNQYQALNTSLVLSLTLVGSFFTVMACIALVNAEGSGLDFTISLPITSRTIIVAKALVATIIYIAVPLVLVVVATIRGQLLLLGRVSLLAPFVELISVASTCLVVIMFFIIQASPQDEFYSDFQPSSNELIQGGRAMNKGKKRRRRRNQIIGFSIMAGSNILRMIEAIATGVTLLAIPLVVYSTSLSLNQNYLSSLIWMLGVAIGELGVALLILYRRT
jgi:predicted permease